MVMIIGGPTRQGIYNGQPYTFQTQPAIGTALTAPPSVAPPPAAAAPSAPSAAPAAPVSGAFQGRTPTPQQQYAFNYFTKAGYSPSFSSAMVATLSGESGQRLNTAPLQGNDASFGGGNGIANWSRSRFNALGQPQGLDAQLAGVVKEINSGAYKTTLGNAAALTTANANPRALTNALTGSAGSGLGFEKPLYSDPIRYDNAPHLEAYNLPPGVATTPPLPAPPPLPATAGQYAPYATATGAAMPPAHAEAIDWHDVPWHYTSADGAIYSAGRGIRRAVAYT
jgi:hypothetical protein